EPNALAQGQNVLSRQVAGDQYMLGAMNAASDADYYKVTLGAGAAFVAATATPASGTGEFVNNLDPQLKLFQADGTLVASDDNGADGRNALLNFTNSGPSATF